MNPIQFIVIALTACITTSARANLNHDPNIMNEANPIMYRDLNGVKLTEKDIQRFWSKISKEGKAPVHKPELGPCWEWTGTYFSSGYAAFCLQHVNRKASRVSYFLHHGSIPVGLNVLHQCDNPSCVRVDHLFLGTTKDNVDDKVSKGRQSRGLKHSLSKLATAARGENNSKSKLTEVDVKEIRRLHAIGFGKLKIAKMFGVTKSPIQLILQGKTWKHVV